MTPKFVQCGLMALAIMVAQPPLSATAQEIASVAAFRDWAVFTQTDPKLCFIAVQPSSWRATRGGQPANGVQRGDIRLFVTSQPNADPTKAVVEQVSYVSGYPIRPDSTVRVDIGSDKHTLNVGAGDAGEWAWAPTPEADAALVASMRKGSEASITAVSSRGTTTIDTFSLLGFTAALEDAAARCK